jgi:hypothetical protein
MPVLKHRHDGVRYLYIFGGDHLGSGYTEFAGSPSDGYATDVWRSTDGETWERVCESDNASFAGRMFVVPGSSPGKLWAFGGQNGLLSEDPGDCVIHNDLHVSTDGGETWSIELEDDDASETRPSPRGVINRMPYWKGRLWLVGGGTYDTPAESQRYNFREVWSIDPEDTASGWTKHTNPPWIGAIYASVEVFHDRLWIMGGSCNVGRVGDGDRNTRWVFSSVDGERWRREETPLWPNSHADGTAVSSDETELARVAGNSSLRARFRRTCSSRSGTTPWPSPPRARRGM